MSLDAAVPKQDTGDSGYLSSDLNSDFSKFFSVKNGVKQACALTQALFSIFFSMILKQATQYLDDDNDAVYICYPIDGSLFNLRRMQVHTRAAVTCPPLR